MADRLICIETSTSICSVCLSENGNLVGVRETLTPNRHTSELAVFINTLLAESGWAANSLDGIALSTGPGSYTGLRIGASIAQGLCYTLDRPLIGVNTLQALAAQAVAVCPNETQAQYLIVMEAKGSEIYWAVYDVLLKCLQIPTIVTLAKTLFEAFAPQQLIIGGNAAERCKEYAGEKAKIFLNSEQNRCSAVNLIKPATDLYNKGVFEDIAYFEPFYAKKYHLSA